MVVVLARLALFPLERHGDAVDLDRLLDRVVGVLRELRPL